MHDLVEVLQRERDLLERLRYRYVGLELLVATRQVPFLEWAVHDVQLARHRAREADLVRAAAVARVAGDAPPSLREVAAGADAPWAGMLRDHHDGLCAVVAEIELHSHRIARRTHDSLATLARTGDLEPATDAVGVGLGSRDLSPAPVLALGPSAPAALDPLDIECVLGEVLTATSRLRMPALLEFLR